MTKRLRDLQAGADFVEKATKDHEQWIKDTGHSQFAREEAARERNAHREEEARQRNAHREEEARQRRSGH